MTLLRVLALSCLGNPEVLPGTTRLFSLLNIAAKGVHYVVEQSSWGPPIPWDLLEPEPYKRFSPAAYNRNYTTQTSVLQETTMD